MIKQIEDWNYKKIIQEVKNIQEWEKVFIDFLGKKGKVNKLFSQIKTLKPEERKIFGQKLNEIKKEIGRLLEIKKLEIRNLKKDRFFDPTLPGKVYPKGSLHPLTSVIEEIVSIFSSIGFIRVSYPEVEWEYFSFEALNMPKGHPARDDFETFFMDYPENKKYGRMVLSPHT
ncbi:MAG: phenylalanine--tRNA ligase subunit alpha, partial [Patescibacteria group bacterium]|nr:phenylalanine--tRNA ligase subunit alpha [Patescibacteria group bacterium]